MNFKKKIFLLFFLHCLSFDLNSFINFNYKIGGAGLCALGVIAAYYKNTSFRLKINAMATGLDYLISNHDHYSDYLFNRLEKQALSALRPSSYIVFLEKTLGNQCGFYSYSDYHKALSNMRFEKNNTSDDPLLKDFDLCFQEKEYLLKKRYAFATISYAKELMYDLNKEDALKALSLGKPYYLSVFKLNNGIRDLSFSNVFKKIKEEQAIVESVKNSHVHDFFNKGFLNKSLSSDEFFQNLITYKNFFDVSVLNNSYKNTIRSYFVSALENYMYSFSPQSDKEKFKDVFLKVAGVYAEFERPEKNNNLRKNILCIYDVLSKQKVLSVEDMIFVYQSLQNKFSFKDLVNDFTYFMFQNYGLLEGDKVVLIELFKDGSKEIREKLPFYDKACSVHDKKGFLSFYQHALVLWKKAFGRKWKIDLERYDTFSEINILEYLLNGTYYERRYEKKPLYIIGRELSSAFKTLLNAVQLSDNHNLQAHANPENDNQLEQKKNYLKEVVSLFYLSKGTTSRAYALFDQAMRTRFDSTSLSFFQVLDDSLKFCGTSPSDEIIIKYRDYYNNKNFTEFFFNSMKEIEFHYKAFFENLTYQEIQKFYENLVSQEFIPGLSYCDLFEECRKVSTDHDCLLKREGEWFLDEPIHTLDLCRDDEMLRTMSNTSDKKSLWMSYLQCLNKILLITKAMNKDSSLQNYFKESLKNNCVVESLFFIDNALYDEDYDIYNYSGGYTFFYKSIIERVYTYYKNKCGLPLSTHNDIKKIFDIADFLYRNHSNILHRYSFLKNPFSGQDSVSFNSDFFKSLKSSLEQVAHFSFDMEKAIHTAAEKYLDHSLMSDCVKTPLKKAILICNTYRKYAPDRYLSSEKTPLLEIWSEFCKTIRFLELYMHKEYSRKNIFYLCLFSFDQEKTNSIVNTVLDEFTCLENQDKLLNRLCKRIELLAELYFIKSKKYESFCKEDWESVTTYKKLYELQEVFFKTALYSILHLDFFDYQLHDISKKSHLLSKKILLFMKEVYDEYKKYSIKYPSWFKNAKAFEVCLMGNIFNRVTYEHTQTLKKEETIIFGSPHDYLKKYIEITCFFPCAECYADPSLLLSYIRHNSNVVFSDDVSTYIDDLEQEYKKRIFDYFINKGNKIDNNFKKISMKAFSLYNTLTNYFEKKQKASLGDSASGKSEKLFSDISQAEFEQKFLTTINLVNAINIALFRNQKAHTNSIDFNNRDKNRSLLLLIEVFDYIVNSLHRGYDISCALIQGYLIEHYRDETLYPSFPSAIQVINYSALGRILRIYDDSYLSGNFFYQKDKIVSDKEKRIRYGGKYLFKFKKNLIDLLKKNLGPIERRSLRKVTSGGMPTSHLLMQFLNKRNFSSIQHFQKIMQKNSGMKNLIHVLCNKRYFQSLPSLHHSGPLNGNYMILKNIKDNDKSVPPAIYYYAYGDFLELYLKSYPIPLELLHLLVDSFFASLDIKPASKNVFLKIIKESSKLQTQKLPVERFEEIIKKKEKRKKMI